MHLEVAPVIRVVVGHGHLAELVVGVLVGVNGSIFALLSDLENAVREAFKNYLADFVR